MRENNEGLRWLQQAQEDLKWAKVLQREGGYNLACFLAQQVAEKALKAYLYAQGEEIVTGHSVDRLCDWATDYDPKFQEKAESWASLDGYYVPTRYPNSLPGSIPAKVYNKDQAQDALELAEDVITFVNERIFKSENKGLK